MFELFYSDSSVQCSQRFSDVISFDSGVSQQMAMVRNIAESEK